MIFAQEEFNHVEVYPGMNRVYLTTSDGVEAGVGFLSIEEAEKLLEELPDIIALAAARRLSVYQATD